jgi:hypothetical protein
VTEDSAVNPMDKAHAAPRCSATSKRTGQPCQAPAVRGWKVCRFHGAGGGAPRGPSHGRYRHGQFTCDAVESRREVRELIREATRLAAEL